MISVTPFHKSHVFKMGKILTVYDGHENLLKEISDIGDSRMSLGFTFWENDKAIAIVMGVMIYGYICDIVAVLTEEIKESGIDFTRTCVRLMKIFEKKFGVKRFQMSVKVGYSNGERFANFLGFKKEGTLEYYGADRSDYHIYSRLQKWA